MKYISENDYNTIKPFGNREYWQALNDNQKQNYLEYYTLYRLALNKYMAKKVLSKYDNLLANSEFRFEKVLDEDKDIYQALSDLNYYYVRNNIYIERIDEKYLQEFKNSFIGNSFELTADMSNFIENTFSNIILENIKSKYSMFFGPNSSIYLVNDGSLIIGFRYNEFNLNGMSDDEWDINNDNQWNVLQKINDELQKELQQVLGIEVAVIQYDDLSVDAINNSQNKVV